MYENHFLNIPRIKNVNGIFDCVLVSHVPLLQVVITPTVCRYIKLLCICNCEWMVSFKMPLQKYAWKKTPIQMNTDRWNSSQFFLQFVFDHFFWVWRKSQAYVWILHWFYIWSFDFVRVCMYVCIKIWMQCKNNECIQFFFCNSCFAHEYIYSIELYRRRIV